MYFVMFDAIQLHEEQPFRLIAFDLATPEVTAVFRADLMELFPCYPSFASSASGRKWV